MRKINIGAGTSWQEQGWESLDNGPGDYSPSWRHQGKCWDNSLPANTFDIVFTSHMLEHIPQFRLEKTISEFNRILKTGGTLRLLVPDLKKAANAYINGDKAFFANSSHYSDHMGIGASFVRVLISPGSQTIAISREMDEIFGGYAHLYSYDFEMLKTLLEKWGFDDIMESEPGESKIEDMRSHQHIVHDGEQIAMTDDFYKTKAYLKTGNSWNIGGFDKTSTKQLVIEATKSKTVNYQFENEFEFFKGGRIDSPIDKFKFSIVKFVFKFVDIGIAVVKTTGISKIFQRR